MNLINKVKYTWHSMNLHYYEALMNDCLSTAICKKLRIKANYHRELANHYTETNVPTQSAG